MSPGIGHGDKGRGLWWQHHFTALPHRSYLYRTFHCFALSKFTLCCWSVSFPHFRNKQRLRLLSKDAFPIPVPKISCQSSVGLRPLLGFMPQLQQPSPRCSSLNLKLMFSFILAYRKGPLETGQAHHFTSKKTETQQRSRLPTQCHDILQNGAPLSRNSFSQLFLRWACVPDSCIQLPPRHLQMDD